MFNANNSIMIIFLNLSLFLSLPLRVFLPGYYFSRNVLYSYHYLKFSNNHLSIIIIIVSGHAH